MQKSVKIRRFFIIPALLASALWLTPAGAVDGVSEINQACIAAGCFAGDSAGFPVQITAPGSYRLTSNLTVPDADTTAIFVTVPHVTVDLNGFTIQGITRCNGAPAVCTDTGTGDGVAIDVANLPFGITVKNGQIFGMGRHGVFLVRTTNVIDLQVEQCGGTGIVSGEQSEVRGSSSISNGNHGFSIGIDTSVVGNRALHNGSRGFSINGSAAVERNTAELNGAGGFFLGSNSTVANNTATTNQGPGFEAGLNTIFRGNTATFNTTSGISSGEGNLLVSNIASDNTGTGLVLDVDTVYRSNVMTGNTVAPVTGGINRGENYCDGTGTVMDTCP